MSNFDDQYSPDYNDYLEELKAVKPLTEEILDTDSVSPLFKKLITSTRTAEQLQQALEGKILQKSTDLSGYSSGTIVKTFDADSGVFLDKDGIEREYRLADLNMYDAVDKAKARTYNPTKNKLQSEQVAKLTGKDINDLAESDFINVYNYQHQQSRESFNNKNPQLLPYDPNIIYDAPTEQEALPFSYKVVGEDDNGRLLLEAVNPTTGRQVSFDLSNNPYTNSRFDLWKSLDTETNRNRLEKYEQSHQESVNVFKGALSNEGRLAEDIDLVQSAAYQSAARALQHGPEFLVDKKKWEKIANAQTGQALADAWAEVNPKTRLSYIKGMQSASDEWDKGNRLSAIIDWTTQLDRVLAESATQMALFAGSTLLAGAATGGTGAVANVSSRIGTMLLGAMPAGLDKTLATAEEYKANNNGEEMSAAQLAEAFALNTVTLVPEGFLLKLNINKVLPKDVASQFMKAYKTKAVASRAKVVGKSAFSEFGQEALETGTENYLSQNQATKTGLLENIFSDEAIKGGVIGGLAGGALSGTATGITAPLSIKKEVKYNKAIDAIIEQQDRYTTTGKQANVDASNSVQEAIKNISIDNHKDINDVITTVQALDSYVSQSDLNITTIKDIANKRTSLIKDALTKFGDDTTNRDTFLKALGKSKEEVFQEMVFYSDINGASQFQKGKEHLRSTNVDMSYIEQAKSELFDIATKLGINKDTAHKIMSDVSTDIKNGPVGYDTYNKQIQAINKQLENTSLTKEERTTLENHREDFAINSLRLYNNQVSKLKQFLNAFKQIEAGANKALINNPVGKPFTVLGTQIANDVDKFNGNYGVYGVINNILKEAKDIKNILNNLPKEVQDAIATSPTGAIQWNPNEDLDNILSQLKDTSSIISHNAKARVAITKPKASTDSLLIKKLEAISNGKLKDNIETLFINQIRNSSKEQLTSIRNIISTSNNNNKTTLLETLDRIEKLDQNTEQEVKSIKDKQLDIAKEKLDKFQKLDTTSLTVEEKNNVLQQIKYVADTIKTHNTEEANELLKPLREVYKLINNTPIEKPSRMPSEDVKTKNDIKVYPDTKNVSNTPLKPKMDIVQPSVNKEGEIKTTLGTKEQPINPPDTVLTNILTDEETTQEEIDAYTEQQDKQLEKDKTIVDRSNEASYKLLDPKTNNSVTFMPSYSNQPFNLNDELVLSSNPSSSIATTGAKPEYIASIKQKMQSLFIDLKKTSNGLIKSPIGYLTAKTEGTGHSMLADAPHLRLLYDITQTGLDLVFTPQDTTIAAIDLSVHELFATMGSSHMFNPYTIYQLAKTYGISVEELKLDANTVNQLREVVEKHGIPRNQLASVLGNLILRNLGISQNTETGTDVYSKIVVNLGTFALRYAEELGYVTQSTFDPDVWLEEHDDVKTHVLKFPISSVKFNTKTLKYIANIYLGNRNFKGVRTSGLKKEYKLSTIIRVFPRLGKTELPNNMKIKGTNGLMKVPAFMKKVMNKMWNLPFVLNTERVSFVLDNIEAIKKQLGYIDESEFIYMSYNAIETAKGVNMTIDRELQHLKDVYTFQTEKNVLKKSAFAIKWYFDWFMSKNGRLFMDSSHINPQADKNLARFLLVPENFEKTYDPNNEEDNKSVYYALAQAFKGIRTNKQIMLLGEALSKLSLEEVNQLEQDILNLSSKELAAKYNSLYTFNGKQEGIGGIENLGQAIVAVEHIRKIITSNGKPFTSMLATEHDSTTSGFFLKAGQFPSSFNSKLEKQVGIHRDVSTGTEIQNVKHQEGFLDVYQDAAKSALDDLNDFNSTVKQLLKRIENSKSNGTTVDNVVLEDIFGKQLYNSTETNPEIRDKQFADVVSIMSIYDTMLPALPQLTKEGKVSSALRDLFKLPTMMFSYTAGQYAISKTVVSSITNDFVDTYLMLQRAGGLQAYIKKNNTTLTEEDIARLQAIADTLNKMKRMYKGNFFHALRTKPLYQIKLSADTSVESMFNDVLMSTYGKHVFNALSNKYSQFSAYSNSMVQMTISMFDVFDEKLTSVMKDLHKQYPNGIPIQEEKKAIKSLLKVYPAIKLAYSNYLNEGMFFAKTTRDIGGDNYGISPYNKDGILYRDTTHPNIKKFIAAGQAGAVLPIHFLDGMAMALTLQKYNGLIPVHDAVVISAKDNLTITQELNRNVLLVCKDFDVYTEMVMRFKEVMKEGNAENKTLIDSEGYPVQMYNANLSYDEYLQLILIPLMEENQEDRTNFYNNDIYVSNFEGMEGSGVIVKSHETLTEKLFKDAIYTYSKYSSPEGYRTDGDITDILYKANNSIEGRIELVDTLQDMSKDLDNIVEDPTYIDHIKDLLSRINLEGIKDIIVQYSKTQDYNVGSYDVNTNSITVGFDNKSDIDPITKMSPFSDKSPVEIYAHETIHAAIGFGLANSKAFDLTDKIKQLMTIQKRAMEVITWQDLMPSVYDSKLEAVYEKHAKDLWSYMFNTPSKEGEFPRSLHEFIAHGLTNTKVMNKLREHTIITDSISPKMKLLDKLVYLVKSIFDIVFGSSKFNTVFKVGHEVLKGNIPLKYKRTLYEELDILATQISFANTKATNKLMKHPVKALETVFKLVADFRVWGNNLLAPRINTIINIADTKGYTQDWYNDLHMSKFDAIKLLGKIILLFPFSDSRRRALNMWLKEVVGLSHQGMIQTVVRELQEPDMQTNRISQISALTRLVEQASKELESTTYNNLLENFGKKELTQEETYSLTTTVLRTDLSSLFTFNTEDKTSNIEYIKTLLSDENKLKQEIEHLTNKLKSSEHFNYYDNASRALADYMITGIGNNALPLNAMNIANRTLTNTSIKASKETIQTIDKLVSLLALQQTDISSRAIVNSLSTKGLENFLRTHQVFEQTVTEGTISKDINNEEVLIKTVEDIHKVKGHIKEIFDNSFDIKLATIKEETDLNKEGFKLIYKLGTNKVTGQHDLALYRRSFAVPKHREGAGVILTSGSPMGTTLKESTVQIIQNMPIEQSQTQLKHLHEVFFDKVTNTRKKLQKLMETRTLTVEEMRELSSSYIPIASPLKTVSDYRITMSNAHKESLLGMNMDGLNILSKMYATHNTKTSSSLRNQTLLYFLLEDRKNNMNEETHRDDLGHEYIHVTENTDNKFIKNAWAVIPKEFKDEIAKGDFWVRIDWLADIFGTPSMSLSEAKVLANKDLPRVRLGLAVGEYILRHIASMAKQNNILRTPTVLLGNIISNFNYSILNGSNPIKVYKYTLQNARNIRDYIDTKKSLNKILFKQKLGTADQSELNSINWHKSKLSNNPVHPLMKKGMYQAIVEDINPYELENVGKINKLIKGSKILSKIPSPVQKFFKQMYMLEGTGIFDFMFQATQYSDFIARATEYQLQMEKAPKQFTTTVVNGVKVRTTSEEYLKYEEDVTTDIWNAFINYDKPQSSGEQYLNDIGLIMFSKFYKRIQHQITKGVLTNPMGVLMFLLTQQVNIINSDDILEQSVFVRPLSSVFYNPVDNAINAFTPIPIQFATGMRYL